MRWWGNTHKPKRWTSAFRRPFLIERRHRYAWVLRRQLPALRAVQHPRRRRLTVDDLKLSRAA